MNLGTTGVMNRDSQQAFAGGKPMKVTSTVRSAIFSYSGGPPLFCDRDV